MTEASRSASQRPRRRHAWMRRRRCRAQTSARTARSAVSSWARSGPSGPAPLAATPCTLAAGRAGPSPTPPVCSAAPRRPFADTTRATGGCVGAPPYRRGTRARPGVVPLSVLVLCRAVSSSRRYDWMRNPCALRRRRRRSRRLPRHRPCHIHRRRRRRLHSRRRCPPPSPHPITSRPDAADEAPFAGPTYCRPPSVAISALPTCAFHAYAIPGHGMTWHGRENIPSESWRT
jgi:hypothetical protein